jgi:hypothetical protein
MKTRLDVKERKKDRVWVVSIDPFFQEENEKYFHRDRVSVHSQLEATNLGDEYRWTPAQVSWYSIGAVNVDEAATFADAIQKAIEHGRKMDIEHGFAVSPC